MSANKGECGAGEGPAGSQLQGQRRSQLSQGRPPPPHPDSHHLTPPGLWLSLCTSGEPGLDDMAGLGGTSGGTRPYRSGHRNGCTGHGLGMAAVGPGHIAPEPAGLLWGDKAIGGAPWGQQGWEPLLERQACKTLRSYEILRPSGCKRIPQPLRPLFLVLCPLADLVLPIPHPSPHAGILAIPGTRHSLVCPGALAPDSLGL